jgi:hypothetical protein
VFTLLSLSPCRHPSTWQWVQRTQYPACAGQIPCIGSPKPLAASVPINCILLPSAGLSPAAPAHHCFLSVRCDAGQKALRALLRVLPATYVTVFLTHSLTPPATHVTGGANGRGARLPPAAPVCPPRYVRKQCLCTILVSRSLLRCLRQRCAAPRAF